MSGQSYPTSSDPSESDTPPPSGEPGHVDHVARSMARSALRRYKALAELIGESPDRGLSRDGKGLLLSVHEIHERVDRIWSVVSLGRMVWAGIIGLFAMITAGYGVYKIFFGQTTQPPSPPAQVQQAPAAPPPAPAPDAQPVPVQPR